MSNQPHRSLVSGVWIRVRHPFRSLLLLGCLAAPAAAAPLTAESSVDDILNALHERGAGLKSLAADVKLTTETPDFGDDPDTRAGKLVLLRPAENETRVRIIFTQRQRGRKLFEEKQEFVIDGQRLIERNHAPDQKKEITRIVGKPGDKLDLFKLGQGPFPLPIGQPRQDVLDAFDVKKTPLADITEQPGDAVCGITLTPRPDTPIAKKFATVDVTVRADGWPVEVRTIDTKPSPQQVTARLDNIRANGDVDSNEFALPPLPSDWNRITEDMGE